MCAALCGLYNYGPNIGLEISLPRRFVKLRVKLRL
jgi:hypothetical protein